MNATPEAINSWNKTGTFTFKETTNKNEANIVVQQIEDNTTSVTGITTTSYNPLTNHPLKAQVKLNTYYLQSVMYPAGLYYSIQEQDINAARDSYKSAYAA